MAVRLPSLKSIPDAIQSLKGMAEENDFSKILEELIQRLENGDKEAWSLIYQVMRDADSGRLSWGLHRELLSGVIYALAEVGDSQSYRIVISYIKSLDREIPVGAMDLIGQLLPVFREMDLKEIIRIASDKNEYKSAFGLIALSNILVEKPVTEEQAESIRAIVEQYENKRYFLPHVIESIHDGLEAAQGNLGSFSEEELSSLFE